MFLYIPNHQVQISVKDEAQIALSRSRKLYSTRNLSSITSQLLKRPIGARVREKGELTTRNMPRLKWQVNSSNL